MTVAGGWFRWTLSLLLVCGLAAGAWFLGLIGGERLDRELSSQPLSRQAWSDAELVLIRSLWLDSLPPLAPDASNAVADDEQAARLGHRLFFDTRFSSTGLVACSTCHQPDRYFTDGLQISVGIGTVTRNAMTLVGAAYSPWYFWDGRKDSLWSQALGPLENGLEHGGNRLQIAHVIANDGVYRALYEPLFGKLPELSDAERFPARAGPMAEADLVLAWEQMEASDRLAVSTLFANLGKALAAYQRKLLPGPSRFDSYAGAILEPAGVSLPSADLSADFTGEEQAGLKLFIGRGQCVNCHNGPLFTNHEFHNTGSLSVAGQLPSRGRSAAVSQVLEDPFNCLGAFSDVGKRAFSDVRTRAFSDVATDRHACPELRFIKTGDELVGAHRTPSLRNVASTAPYMHAGQLGSLEEVVAQYNLALDAMIGHNEAEPLELSDAEQAALVAFLRTLDGKVAAEPRWLQN